MTPAQKGGTTPAAAPTAAAPAAPGVPGAAPPPEAYGAAVDTNAQMHTLVNSLLAAPSSMTPEYVNQLKEVNKEESTGLAQQLAHKLKLDAAARGTSFSGNEAMRGEKIGEAMNADIIRQNRAVDMQKAQTDRSDLLSALGIGQGYNQSAEPWNSRTNWAQGVSPTTPRGSMSHPVLSISPILSPCVNSRNSSGSSTINSGSTTTRWIRMGSLNNFVRCWDSFNGN
jgi:hypothetical protein